VQSVTLVAAGLLAGIVVGFGAGRRYQRAARGVSDYRNTKRQVPILRRAAYTLIRHALGYMAVAVALAVAAGYALATHHHR
jgi:hypothetical protein